MTTKSRIPGAFDGRGDAGTSEVESYNHAQCGSLSPTPEPSPGPGCADKTPSVRTNRFASIVNGIRRAASADRIPSVFFLLSSILWVGAMGMWAADQVIAQTSNVGPIFDEGTETIRFVGEETAPGGDFGSPISATDGDGDRLTYALGGTDGDHFDIDAATGQLRTAAGTTLEYETRSSYEVLVAVRDGRGGAAAIVVNIHVLDSLVIVPPTPAVRNRVRVTVNESEIDEGEEVTFKFELSAPAPSGGVKIFYSLKQIAEDGDSLTYDFRPISNLNTHHRTSVTIGAGRTFADVTYRTGYDEYDETDVFLIADIGFGAHIDFDGTACSYTEQGNIPAITSRSEDCWARVKVDDGGGSPPPEVVPVARYASVFPGHVREFTGTNVQYILPGESLKLTISVNVAAPRGGLEVYYGLSERSSNVNAGIPQYPNIDVRKVTIPAGKTEAFVEVALREQDPLAEDCGVGTGCITASIYSPRPVAIGNGHYLPYEHHPSLLRYHANTIISRAVTITPDQSPIPEGGTAQFTVQLSSPAPTGGLDVEVALSQEGDFAADPLPETRTVTVAGGARTAPVSVATVDDEVDEEDGKIVAAVQPRSGVYVVGTPGEAEVVVRDDEVVVIDEDPTVTIVEDRSPISEGETAQFTVQLSTPAPEGGLAVEVSLSQEGDFAADPLPETRTVTVGVGARTAPVSVATVNDEVDEEDGKIVAAVQPRSGVYVVGTPGEAEVVVRDDEDPTVTIVEDRSPISEGETAQFTVRLSSPAPTGGLAVEVSLSQEGDFAADPLPQTRTVTVGAGVRTAPVSVATVNDEVDEEDGKIVAAVQPRSDVYAVGTPGEAEVVVRDDEDPTVTIVADRSPISEGETAQFTVQLSTPAPEGGLAVEVSLSQEGDFAADPLPETRTVTVGVGARTAPVSVATVNDEVDEEDGKIVAAVQPRSGVYVVGTPGEAEVVVRDLQGPTVTITADRSPIPEGGTAQFTVRLSTPAPEGGLAVEVSLSQEGDFAADPLPQTRTVTVAGGARTAPVSVATVNDEVDEEDGKIVAAVRPRSDVYAVGTPGEAEVVVRDDEDPTVTIVADRSPVSEGETAQFTVQLSSPAPTGGLAVEVSLSQEGDFAAVPLPQTRTVMVGAGVRTAPVSVATVDDEVDEEDGKIVAAVRPRSDVYVVGTPGEAEVVVRDDEVVVLDEELTVTIVEDRSPITEGETAQFTVHLSSLAPEGGLAVEVSLSQEGDFAADPLPETRTVTVAGGARMAPVSVATVNDEVDEEDGKIVAAVQPRSGVYVVGTPGEAEVVVRDDDDLIVTIVADRSPITEGETAQFTVRLSSPAPTGGLAVEVSLSQEGDFAADPLPQTRTVTVGAGARTAPVSVATVNDEVDEEDGKIVAAVQPRSDVYAVGTPGEAEVVVRDDDDLIVTIVADRSPISEGETAQFTVRLSSPAPTGGLDVEVSLSQEGDFAADPLPETRTVTVGVGARTAPVSVATVNDEVDEEDGKIVAAVQPRSGVYAVGTPGEAEVVVRDDDAAADPSVAILERLVPRLGRTVAGIVTKTIDCERYSRFPVDHVTIGGHEVQPRRYAGEDIFAINPEDAASWNRDELREETGMSAEQVLQGSSFAGGTPDRDDGTGMAHWGEGAVAGFSGRYEELSMNGTAVSGIAGIEDIVEDTRRGIAVAQTVADIEFGSTRFGSGSAQSSLTSLHPYLCWFPSDDSFMWGMLGYGWGDMSLSGPENVEGLDTFMRMGAIGVTDRFLSRENYELVGKANAFAVSMHVDESPALPSIKGDVFSFRGILENSWEHDLESGAVLRSSLDLGIRYDLGDAEQGRSFGLGGGVRYVAPEHRGVLAELTGHTLVHHADSAFEDWGINGHLRFDRRRGERNASLEFDLGYGQPRGDARRILDSDVLVSAGPEDTANPGAQVGVRLRDRPFEPGGVGIGELHGGVALDAHGSIVFSSGLGFMLGDHLDLTFGVLHDIKPRREGTVILGLRSQW